MQYVSVQRLQTYRTSRIYLDVRKPHRSGWLDKFSSVPKQSRHCKFLGTNNTVEDFSEIGEEEFFERKNMLVGNDDDLLDNEFECSNTADEARNIATKCQGRNECVTFMF
ncbi:hypothetical protein TNCV_3590971 [Trichonephila clavipes]|nr:hypothetical protein TNCV_3590971 [Trichonephila clavipes]